MGSYLPLVEKETTYTTYLIVTTHPMVKRVLNKLFFWDFFGSFSQTELEKMFSDVKVNLLIFLQPVQFLYLNITFLITLATIGG